MISWEGLIKYIDLNLGLLRIPVKQRSKSCEEVVILGEGLQRWAERLKQSLKDSSKAHWTIEWGGWNGRKSLCIDRHKVTSQYGDWKRRIVLGTTFKGQLIKARGSKYYILS